MLSYPEGPWLVKYIYDCWLSLMAFLMYHGYRYISEFTTLFFLRIMAIMKPSPDFCFVLVFCTAYTGSIIMAEEK